MTAPPRTTRPWAASATPATRPSADREPRNETRYIVRFGNGRCPRVREVTLTHSQAFDLRFFWRVGRSKGHSMTREECDLILSDWLPFFCGQRDDRREARAVP